MRLLCWNLRDLLGDPLAVHRVVRAAAPDVACFQEAPRRPGAGLRLHLLERGTGLRCVAGGRRSGGTAVFVAPAVDVRWARAFRLAVPGAFHRRRGACVADVDIAGIGVVTVASVHLPLQAALRQEHVRRIAAVVAWRDLPAVVAGDLNEPPGGPAWHAWEPWLRDAVPDAVPTFPAGDPRTRIDAVLASSGLRVRRVASWYDVRDVRRASDHLPVLAEISRATPP